jgi:transposase InsO family protein
MPVLAAAFPDASTRLLCQVLGISRSGWYAHARQPPAERDVALRAAIEDLALQFPGYGYRRITQALRRAGWRVNGKRVLRLMREEALLCQLQRRFVVTTTGRPGLGDYPNRLRAEAPSQPNQAWVADITSIRLPTTFCYLATLLDAYSRLVVGWELSRRIDTDLTLGALERALAVRQPAPGGIHHSDHGVQYASTRYVARLEAAGARISLATKGNVYENALAESFFATLKREEVHLHEYQTLAEAEARLEQFIETIYNHKRLHSSLGYRPPSEVDAAWRRTHDDNDFWDQDAIPALVVVR